MFSEKGLLILKQMDPYCIKYLKFRSNSNIKIKGEIDRKINPYSRCEVA